MPLGEVHIQRALFSLPIGRKYSSSWTPNLASGIFPKAMANGILLTIQAIILLNAMHFENTDLLAKSLGKAIYLGPAGGMVERLRPNSGTRQNQSLCSPLRKTFFACKASNII